MSLSHPNTPISQQDLHDFYNKIKPYMGTYPSAIVNKFSKGDLYSTDEKMIGQWVDGKPLYQLTYHISERITASPYVFGSITGFNVVNMWGNCKLYKNSTSAYAGRMNFDGQFSSSDTAQINLKTNYGEIPTQMVIYFSGSFYLEDTYITIQYTKTTDSAISIGNDTDYSTDEKIIGTWIDGKPIYQKTVVTTTPSTSGVDTVVAQTSTWNIDTPINVKAFTLGNWNNVKYNQEIPYREGSNPESYVYLSSGSSEQTFIQFNSSDDLYCKCGNARTNVPLYITLQYTKTV